jgi:hypothetical protein
MGRHEFTNGERLCVRIFGRTVPQLSPIRRRDFHYLWVISFENTEIQVARIPYSDVVINNIINNIINNVVTVRRKFCIIYNITNTYHNQPNMQTNFFQKIFNCIETVYENYKINCAKRQKFNNQIIKHKLTMCQYFSIKRRMDNDGCDDDEEEDESTFRKLDYVSELGLAPSNENLWPVIINTVNKKGNGINNDKRKIIPANVSGFD